MAKQCVSSFFTLIVFLILVSRAMALTDPMEVTVLQDLYRALNYPPQLKGWRVDGGDPCEESWKGVSCSGSSVLYLKLRGLNLSGYLGGQLYNLHYLKQMDVSSNNILGEIPYGLPPNATHLNLACNSFSQNIPHTLPSIKNLRHLNLSHNSLSGPIGNVFTGLENLKEMDLSYNNFTGDLSSSFGSLTNLNGLYLQNNEFTGSVVYLSELPLTDLNIQDNHFSGVIPKHFQTIPNLWIGGNKFHVEAQYPPWNFPFENVPVEQNISSPPTTQSSAIENYPPRKIDGHKKKRMGPGGIAFIVGGVTLVTTCAALYTAIRINRSRAQKLRYTESSVTTHSLPISTAREFSLGTPEEIPRLLAVSSPPILGPRLTPPGHPTRTGKTSRRKSFSKNYRVPASAKVYALTELQLATNSFSQENLLGEGSLGAVYRAEFPDGLILALKKINMVALSFHEEDKFLDLIWTASRLRHPNIITLVGYCVEHGQNLLVYEYVRNLTLDEALHSEAYKPLSWSLRLRIALGVARALDYLHSTISPPVAHSNIKAANILLDEEHMPRLCDTGLAILRPLTSTSVKLKASEMAISDNGYTAPEDGQQGIDNTKSDIYAFGVLLLELLTGRRPFDDTRPRVEQYLVKWASSQLHDCESLEHMVDPVIKRTFSPKALSRFADVISFCIQPKKEFRLPMSEIVDSLICLTQKSIPVTSGAADSTEADLFERSFRSTHTCFINSPTMS